MEMESIGFELKMRILKATTKHFADCPDDLETLGKAIDLKKSVASELEQYAEMQSALNELYDAATRYIVKYS